MQFTVLQKEDVFTGLAFNVNRHRVSYPNGHIAEIDFLALMNTVVVVPVGPDGNIWFVRQYRHAAGQILLELPAGKIEKDESPEVCAQRELREEIGMAAESLQHISEFFVAPGYSSEYMHVFLATQLSHAPLPPDVDELITVMRIPLEEVLSMLVSSQFKDAKTVAALSLARPLITPQP